MSHNVKLDFYKDRNLKSISLSSMKDIDVAMKFLSIYQAPLVTMKIDTGNEEFFKRYMEKVNQEEEILESIVHSTISSTDGSIVRERMPSRQSVDYILDNTKEGFDHFSCPTCGQKAMMDLDSNSMVLRHIDPVNGDKLHVIRYDRLPKEFIAFCIGITGETRPATDIEYYEMLKKLFKSESKMLHSVYDKLVQLIDSSATKGIFLDSNEGNKASCPYCDETHTFREWVRTSIDMQAVAYNQDCPICLSDVDFVPDSNGTVSLQCQSSQFILSYQSK